MLQIQTFGARALFVGTLAEIFAGDDDVKVAGFAFATDGQKDDEASGAGTGNFLYWDGSNWIRVDTGTVASTAATVKRVTGPATSTDHAIPRWDGVTGALLLDSGVTVDDSDNVLGVVALTMTGALTGKNITSVAADNSTTTYSVQISNNAGSAKVGYGGYGMDNSLGSGGIDYTMKVAGDFILQTNDTPVTRLTVDDNGIVTIANILKIEGIKSGATQGAAGAVADEIWKTASHASLPDNVLLIGV